jgi:hypothetical protein
MRALLALAAMLVVSVSCGGSPVESTPAAPGADLGGTLRVSGQVRDYSTGSGVGGITVAFADSSTVTDTDGSYSIPMPSIGTYYPTVDGQRVGTAHVTGASYRGDFLVRAGTCVARYGTVSDPATHKPVSGAMLSLGGKMTGSGVDGWYRLDYGCPAEGWVGFNTIFMSVSHPDYGDSSVIVGRGIAGVARLDIEMQKK